ncbi:hypothetical protein [Prosthecobacter algae]|uniref:hypothetical protein n=1 Tax=Prosthecobacter algae TaxID=1144682 RepID=UPI0031F065DA
MNSSSQFAEGYPGDDAKTQSHPRRPMRDSRAAGYDRLKMKNHQIGLAPEQSKGAFVFGLFKDSHDVAS